MSGKLQLVKQLGHILDEFGNVMSDQSMTQTREQPFDRRVDRLNNPARINGNDTVSRRVQDRCAPAFAVDQGKREAAALADHRDEHEAGCSQCEHQKLESPKRRLRMTLNFEPAIKPIWIAATVQLAAGRPWRVAIQMRGRNSR